LQDCLLCFKLSLVSTKECTMKIRFIAALASVLLVVGLLASCAGAAATPESVAENFLNALKNSDFDKAMTFSTEDAKGMLGMLKTMTSSLTDEQKAEMEKQKAQVVKITKSEANGTDAVKVFYTMGEQPEQSIDVIKKDDKWLVDFKKGM